MAGVEVKKLFLTVLFIISTFSFSVFAEDDIKGAEKELIKFHRDVFTEGENGGLINPLTSFLDRIKSHKYPEAIAIMQKLPNKLKTLAFVISIRHLRDFSISLITENNKDLISTQLSAFLDLAKKDETNYYFDRIQLEIFLLLNTSINEKWLSAVLDSVFSSSLPVEINAALADPEFNYFVENIKKIKSKFIDFMQYQLSWVVDAKYNEYKNKKLSASFRALALYKSYQVLKEMIGGNVSYENSRDVLVWTPYFGKHLIFIFFNKLNVSEKESTLRYLQLYLTKGDLESLNRLKTTFDNRLLNTIISVLQEGWPTIKDFKKTGFAFAFDLYRPGGVVTAVNSDKDKDGKPDIIDEDIDNDGIDNLLDSNPYDEKTMIVDEDKDSIPDHVDWDVNGEVKPGHTADDAQKQSIFFKKTEYLLQDNDSKWAPSEIDLIINLFSQNDQLFLGRTKNIKLFLRRAKIKLDPRYQELFTLEYSSGEWEKRQKDFALYEAYYEPHNKAIHLTDFVFEPFVEINKNNSNQNLDSETHASISIIHEMGHALYEYHTQAFDSWLQDKGWLFYIDPTDGALKSIPKNSFNENSAVTTYAEINAHEFFAENFAFATLFGKDQHSSDQRFTFEFLENKVDPIKKGSLKDALDDMNSLISNTFK